MTLNEIEKTVKTLKEIDRLNEMVNSSRIEPIIYIYEYAKNNKCVSYVNDDVGLPKNTLHKYALKGKEISNTKIIEVWDKFLQC